MEISQTICGRLGCGQNANEALSSLLTLSGFKSESQVPFLAARLEKPFGGEPESKSVNR